MKGELWYVMVAARGFLSVLLVGRLSLYTTLFLLLCLHVCVCLCLFKVSDEDISGEDFFLIFKPTTITVTGNVIIGAASQQYINTVRVCVCVCV